MTVLSTVPQINYGAAQAWSDLSQILPIIVVVVALLLAIVLDFTLSRPYRGTAAALTAVAGLAVALAVAAVRFTTGGGGSAYSGFASGDSFALFFEMLLATLGLLTVVISRVYVRRRNLLEAELYVLLLAAVAGMMALAAATSLVSVFISLETLSVALYVACGYSRRETASQESAVKYLLVGGFASAFLLYGMALTYGATGSTVLSEIGKRVTEHDAHNPLLILSVILLAVGFAYKISGAPFHQWTPDVYQGAPLPITAFMSVGTKAAAFAMIIRVFGTGLAHLQAEWSLILAFVAVASMLVGNLAAIVQTSFKRLMAYSSVAQGGYMLVGVIAGGKSGFGATLFYLGAYLFMNFGAFAVLTVLVTPEREHDRISDLDGLGYRHPLLGVLLTAFMLSLAGFPPSLGFFGKLFLFTAGVQSGWTALVVIAVLASVISVAYYVRVVYHVWSPVTSERPLRHSRAAVGVVTVTAVMALAISLYPALVFALGLTGAADALAAGH